MSRPQLHLVRSRTDLVVAAYDALSRHDLDAFIATILDPGVVSAGIEAGERVGVAAVAQAHRRLHAGFPDLAYSVDGLIEAADHTVAQVSARGTHDGAWGSRPATGRTVHIPFCDVCTWDGRRVVRLHRYWDRQATLQQLGMA